MLPAPQGRMSPPLTQPPCFREQVSLFFSLCRKNSSGIIYKKYSMRDRKIIFKKVFTSENVYDIIPFAHARFSDSGVNPDGVFTCRILGSEANI